MGFASVWQLHARRRRATRRSCRCSRNRRRRRRTRRAASRRPRVFGRQTSASGLTGAKIGFWAAAGRHALCALCVAIVSATSATGARVHIGRTAKTSEILSYGHSVMVAVQNVCINSTGLIYSQRTWRNVAKRGSVAAAVCPAFFKVVRLYQLLREGLCSTL